MTTEERLTEIRARAVAYGAHNGSHARRMLEEVADVDVPWLLELVNNLQKVEAWRDKSLQSWLKKMDQLQERVKELEEEIRVNRISARRTLWKRLTS